jgi:hypothetical protein
MPPSTINNTFLGLRLPPAPEGEEGLRSVAEDAMRVKSFRKKLRLIIMQGDALRRTCPGHGSGVLFFPADNYDVGIFIECRFPASPGKIPMQKYLYIP